VEPRKEEENNNLLASQSILLIEELILNVTAIAVARLIGGFDQISSRSILMCGGCFPGVKRPDSEADHPSPSSAEVKECVELYFHSPIRLHGLVLS
jgi:hypothetical protein